MRYIDDATKGKEFRVEIPVTRLTVKTYEEAMALAKTLFAVGVKDVNIVAFRPSDED